MMWKILQFSSSLNLQIEVLLGFTLSFLIWAFFGQEMNEGDCIQVAL